MGKTSLVAALAVLLGAWSPPQTHPDVSGRWVLESASPAASDVPQALTVRQTLVSTNVAGEPMRSPQGEITIEREVNGRSESARYLVGVVGGVVPGLAPDGSPGGPQQHHRVRWDGNTLIFERGSYTGVRPATGVWSEHGEAWALDADNRLHVVVTTRSATEPPSTRSMVYARR